MSEKKPKHKAEASARSKKRRCEKSDLDKSERLKRKRHEEAESDEGERSKKLRHKERESDKITLTEVNNFGDWYPVFATTPGLDLPTNVSLKAYTRPRKHNTPRPSAAGKSAITENELLLHSDAHPKLDYVAREESAGAADTHIKHYIGVFDTQTGELQVVPARYMVVRPTLKSARTAYKATEPEEAPKSAYESRNALGEAFGTKRAQKAILSRTQNAIRSMTDYSNPIGRAALKPSAAAILGSMSQVTSAMATREELQAAVDGAKPRPQANLQARTPADVYPVETLIGEDVLRDLKVKHWQDAAKVQTTSLYVAKRFIKVMNTGDVKKLKVLRYMLLLIDWYKASKMGHHGVRKLQKRDEVRKAVGMDVEGWIIDAVNKKFAPDFVVNNRAQIYLITHICALALAIDNYEVDLFHLREDLRLDVKILVQYFRELGCKVEVPTESERMKMKIIKAEAPVHRLAKLRLPLDFPKNRKIPLKRR